MAAQKSGRRQSPRLQCSAWSMPREACGKKAISREEKKTPQGRRMRLPTGSDTIEWDGWVTTRALVKLQSQTQN
eukprot:2741359-Amphidinium_carterae.1